MNFPVRESKIVMSSSSSASSVDLYSFEEYAGVLNRYRHSALIRLLDGADAPEFIMVAIGIMPPAAGKPPGIPIMAAIVFGNPPWASVK